MNRSNALRSYWDTIIKNGNRKLDTYPRQSLEMREGVTSTVSRLEPEVSVNEQWHEDETSGLCLVSRAGRSVECLVSREPLVSAHGAWSMEINKSQPKPRWLVRRNSQDRRRLGPIGTDLNCRSCR